MDIPPKIRIPLCVERGSVLNFFIDFGVPERQSKNRYFVVLNRNPRTDLALLLVTSTTQTQKRKEFARRTGISEKTIVEVSVKEYSVFTRDSAFDCNKVFEVKMDTLIKKIEENGSMNYPRIPEHVIKRITDGVKQSPTVSQAIKDLIG